MLKFLNRHIWIVILIVSLLLIPQSISSQSELNGKVLITGIAIDLDEYKNNYKVTAQVLLPSGEKQGSAVVLNFVSATSNNISEAIDMISSKIGKTTGLSHLNFILIGKDVYENKNIMSVMDVFMRDERISNSISFYCTTESAESEIKKTKNFDLSSAIGMENVFTKKEESMSAIVTPVYKFISDGLSESKAQMVSGLYIEEVKLNDENSDVLKSDNSSRLKYYNDIYVFKEGKYVCKINDEDELLGLFLLGSGSKQGVITVKDVNDDVYKNAEVGVHVKNKKVKYKAKFIDNEPVLTIQIAVKNNSIREIHNEDINENNYVANKNYLSVCLKEKLKEKISSSVDKVIENSMAYADIFGLESKFKMQHPKQYKKYKELFGDDFIKQIKINYDVKIGDKE